jgi:hypothetical protein
VAAIPEAIQQAQAAGMEVRVISEHNRHWRVTTPGGRQMNYWGGTHRWFSSNTFENIGGFGAESFRAFLGL